jgi:pyrophosphatase PpaX
LNPKPTTYNLQLKKSLTQTSFTFLVQHRLRCIIFDMDGTLTQTNQLIYESFNHIAEHFIKKRFSPKEIIAFFGPPEEDAIEAMIGPGHLDEAMPEYYQLYAEHHNELASLYPGIEDLLKFVKSKGVLIGLFTGKGRTTTEITLSKFGIASYFDVTITGDDVDHFKPSGDGIRKIMNKYSLKPDEVLMVGDAVADITAARECGVQIAAVVWDSYSKEKVMQTKTDFLYHSVDELHAWLNEALVIPKGIS